MGGQQRICARRKQYYQKAADTRDNASEVNLGLMYALGKRVKRDYAYAASGNADAKSVLGRIPRKRGTR